MLHCSGPAGRQLPTSQQLLLSLALMHGAGCRGCSTLSQTTIHLQICHTLVCITPFHDEPG
jgi:hypothetical protein